MYDSHDSLRLGGKKWMVVLMREGVLCLALVDTVVHNPCRHIWGVRRERLYSLKNEDVWFLDVREFVEVTKGDGRVCSTQNTLLIRRRQVSTVYVNL